MPRNPESDPIAPVTRPDTTSHRVESIPAITVHGRRPNFPNVPDPSDVVIDLGQSPEKPHNWFHS